ncbi:MAG: ribulose-phosphate 3-epimerase [Bacillota bacterium]|nr:ribulose-phosphate 3-epimerase [Bacillota bacterium]HOB91058.1 ribulose-phosphate 3-epimerase [Bacillota bacterium]HPZ54184.1 ribulose-phosphate 3-epimerase [Bacillota bacterium]HQD18279.1 ribulose-phosphate 3-epimerase [Bacillota bacterium]
MIKIAPSILAADPLRIADDVDRIPNADYIHIDVMDGRFVPNLTFGPSVVRALRKHCNSFLDTHLMVESPERFIPDFAEAGSDGITVHVEPTHHINRLLQMIRELGCKPGVSINPGTPVVAVREILDMVSMVLVMTVNPGYGGQTLIRSTLQKVRELADLRSSLGLSFEIQVDGGVTIENVHEYAAAGADVIVAGTAVFGSDDPAAAVERLRTLASRARQR